MKIELTYQNQTKAQEPAGNEIIIGRPGDTGRPDLDLSPDATVSRRHARLYLRDGQWWVEDLGSKFGTFVNGVKLEYRRRLKPGDSLRIGETTLRLPSDEDETPTVRGSAGDDDASLKTVKDSPPPA